MRIFVLCSALLLSACAAPGSESEPVVFEDAYTPTGSLIPRKDADRDGKRVILSREAAQKAMQEVERQSGTVSPRF
jgi:hypothetical protein